MRHWIRGVQVIFGTLIAAALLTLLLLQWIDSDVERTFKNRLNDPLCPLSRVSGVNHLGDKVKSFQSPDGPNAVHRPDPRQIHHLQVLPEQAISNGSTLLSRSEPLTEEEWCRYVQTGTELVRQIEAEKTYVVQSPWTDFDFLDDWGWTFAEQKYQVKDAGAELDTVMKYFGLPLGADSNDLYISSHSYEVFARGRVFEVTLGRFEILYNQEGLIVARRSRSPYAQMADFDQLPEDLNDLVPLRQWSDVAFLGWQRQQGGDVTKMRQLKGIMQQTVVNEETNRVVKRVCGGRLNVAWPGCGSSDDNYDSDDDHGGFPIGSDQAKALLATPNGKGAAYFLLQHKDTFGTMTISNVRVWYSGFSKFPHLLFVLKPGSETAASQDAQHGLSSRVTGELVDQALSDEAECKYIQIGESLLNQMYASITTTTVPQSKWTSFDQLKEWGWDQEIAWRARVGRHLPKSTALQALGLPLDEDHNLSRTFVHRRSVQVAGKVYKATNARFHATYNDQGAIIAEYSKSPLALSKTKGQPSGRPDEIVELRQWSDIVFLAWQDVQDNDKAKMRKLSAIMRDNIVNIESGQIARHVCGDRVGVEWPGCGNALRGNGFGENEYGFSASSREAKMLLASPNGKGVAYFLIQHKEAFGDMVVSSVQLWYESEGDDKPFMLFRIRPASGTQPQPGDRNIPDDKVDDKGITPSNLTRVGRRRKVFEKSLLPRALLTYEQAVAKGSYLMSLTDAGIECVQQSIYTDPGIVGEYGWEYDEWNRGYTSHPLVGDALTSLGLPIDDAANVRVRLYHDEAVTIGDTFYKATEATYINTYNMEGAIIAHDLTSPKYAALMEASPITDIIPLQSWSDLTFLQWFRLHNGDSAGMRKLRAVIQASVVNKHTRNIAAEICGGRREPWPGQVFDKDSTEAKALIGTPNGQGAAWLLLQHKEQLGQMEIVQVQVWYRSDRNDVPFMMFLIQPKNEIKKEDKEQRRALESIHGIVINGTEQLFSKRLLTSTWKDMEVHDPTSWGAPTQVPSFKTSTKSSSVWTAEHISTPKEQEEPSDNLRLIAVH